ncbi:hypothetical protein [Salisaeta longa]|uniref:hypothetical protein n=1 Tax=Salisaeta longa TaxID=503170 RepID=UPI000410DD38|nr:hypothetical protein [Salisaeta longa]
MTHPDFKNFLRLAHDYLHVLQAVHDAPHGMREADIRAHVRDELAGASAAPAPSYVFQQLRTHRLIQPLPEKSAFYELTPLIQKPLRNFQHEQSLITPKVIRAHLEQIGTDRSRLLQCGKQASQEGANRALERINTELEEIRMRSQTNREAILHRVTTLRAATSDTSIQERFAAVLEMMEDHIRPLEEIVRTNGLAETHFARLRKTLERVQRAFDSAPAVQRELKSTSARLRRVRRDVLRNFEAARKEVLPLFDEQRRDSMLVRGASQLLKTVHHEGPDALQLPKQIRLLRFNIRTVLDDDAMRGFLLDMRAYTPAPPAPISQPSAHNLPVDVPNRNHVLARTRQSSPIHDVMAWLVQRYAAAPTRHLLAAYRYVLEAPDLHVSFRGPPRSYTHGDYVLTATPACVRVNASPKTSSFIALS